MGDDHKLRQIRWHCRRGMLELDLWLMGFFDKHYVHLDEIQQQDFQDLLACTDDELFAWLNGRGVPEQANLAVMVALIREKGLAIE